MRKPDRADEIAAAWERERPGTPTSSIGVVTRLWALAKLFTEHRQRELRTAGIDAATLDLLGTLRRSGPPYVLTTRELSERCRVTPGAISQRVARAETAGLVRRETDGRTVDVALTAKGHEVIEQTVDIVLGAEEELLDALAPSQRATLARLLKILLTDLERRSTSERGDGTRSA
ncbi:MAG TPA: MarR family transcriptional regulator [Actinopolymorphaceae bacterium]